MIAHLISMTLLQIQDVNGIRWTHKIENRATFDSLARQAEIPYRMAHLRFTIDRKDGKVYYYDSNVDRHHRQLANATYLSLETADQFFKNNYLSPNRRFMLGWIGYYETLGKWAFEFWEGDTIDSKLIGYASTQIGKTFFAPAAFKPNSSLQERESALVKGLSRIMPAEIHGAQTYEPVNLGRRVGRLRVITDPENEEILPGDIVILKEPPIGLPPVAGMIFSRPTTPLSHLSMMARQWQVPSAYIADPESNLKGLIGQTVIYQARVGNYTIRRATSSEIAADANRHKAGVATPVVDLKVRTFAPLNRGVTYRVGIYGAKASNLSFVSRAGIKGVVVPAGFTIPFVFYREYCARNGLDAAITELLADQQFHRDLTYRKGKLKELRTRFEKGELDPDFRLELARQVRDMFGDKGVFVRSSTSAEDLPGFSGAGLYTTVPNVIGEEAMVAAVKTVWASIWNDQAFAAREQAGISHTKICMAVLLQEGVKADSAGVLVTANPFDPGDKGAIYISAKRGLGTKVVEGKRVPEQLLWRPNVAAVQVLTRSEEESLLTFDAAGGLKEVPIDKGRAVLTDDAVRRLAAAGASIQKLFGNKPQDIEWVVVGKQIYIVQSRPFLAAN